LLKTQLPVLALVPHEELKRMVAGTKLMVRTREAAPYSNVTPTAESRSRRDL
jgi:D-ribose pyranase